MTEQPSWAGHVPSYSGVRGPLPPPQWDEVSQNTLDDLRLRLRESITESILLALRGFFLPGPLGTAFDQLVEWASMLLDAEAFLAAIQGEYEGDNFVLQAIQLLFFPFRLFIEPLAVWLSWLWKLFANIEPNPPPTGPGADLLVPIFTLIDTVWDAFTTAAGNLLEDLFGFLNWLWRRFANIPGDNPAPTGPGFDLLVPIFSFIDDVWDAFTTAAGNLLEDLFGFLNWLWRRFANIPGDNPAPTGPGFDLLVPIFSFLDDVWDAFTTATGNLLEDLFGFFNWLWRRFANIPGPNPAPTGPGFDLLVPIFSFLDGIWDAFGEALQGVFTFVMNVFQPMAAIFNDNVVGTVIKDVVEFFNGIINTFGSIADGLPSFADLGQTILSLINSITGGFADAIADGLASIINLFATIPVIGNLINAIIPPESQWRNPITAQPASSLADLRTYANELIRTDSVIYSQNLQGQIPVDLLPVVSPGSVGSTNPNLVADAGFRSATAVQAGDGWSWDAAVSRTSGDGGSAKVTCDGGTKQMFSNLVAVSPGQELECSVWARWTKPSAARPTISVGLRGYINDTVVFTQPLNPRTNIVENSSSFSGNVGGWVETKGTYLIPGSQPLTHVRLVLSVMNAPAGTSVWFDEAALRKVSLIGQTLIAGASPGSNLADDIENAVGTDQYQDLLDRVAKKTGATLADVQATVDDFLDGDSQISGNQITAGNIASTYINELRGTWDKIYTGVKDSVPPAAGDLDSAFDALASWRTVIASAGGQSSGAVATSIDAERRVSRLETDYTLLREYVGKMAVDVREVTLKAGLTPTTPPTPPGETPINFTSVNDNFDRASIGGGWSLSYRATAGSALIIPDGTNAFFQVPEFYNTHNTFSAVYQGGNSSTEYQRVFCTLGSAPGRPGLGSPGYNDLLGRVASPTQCIVARFYNDPARTIRLFWRSGSLEVDPFGPSNQFGVFNMPSDLTSGSVLEFHVGTKSANDQTKCFVRVGTWSSAVATMNASALTGKGRGWGFGGGNGLSFPAPLSVSQYAGKVNFWGAQDQ